MFKAHTTQSSVARSTFDVERSTFAFTPSPLEGEGWGEGEFVEFKRI